MALSTKTFTTLVQDWAAAAQGASVQLLDFTVGSILRAVSEASGGVSLWLQGLVLQTLTVARLATSSGVDVDSFVADFGLVRLPAIAASGLVTFSRITPTNQAVVPIGAQLQTVDGSQTFKVYVDTSNSAYSSALGGYVIPTSVVSVAAPVQAVTPGTAGNVVAGVLTILQTGISGVDAVTNASGFTNGLNAETDSALRLRFIAFILSLQKATIAAVSYAIATVQQGLSSAIIENQNFDTSARSGYFTVVIDDGSGAPPAALLTSVYQAIDKVRPVTTSFGVFAPAVTLAAVNVTLVLAPGYDRPTLAGQVAIAFTAYINGLGMNTTLPYTRLAQIAYDISPGITGLTNLFLNGTTADLVADPRRVIRAGTITVG